MPHALWIPPSSGPLPITQAPSDCGEKEHEGSTPGWSHPLQITICTRHLRAELSRWRENKQGESWENEAWSCLLLAEPLYLFYRSNLRGTTFFSYGLISIS